MFDFFVPLVCPFVCGTMFLVALREYVILGQLI